MWNRIKRSLYVPVLSLLLVLAGYGVWINQTLGGPLEGEEIIESLIDLDQYFIQEEPEMAQQVLEQDAVSNAGLQQETTEILTEQMQFVLRAMDGHVVVYDKYTDMVYLTTGIMLEDLPEETKQEVIDGKEVFDEMELFSFLETHSS